MLSYAKLKRNRRQFLALTGLTPKEFQLLLPSFARAYTRRFPSTHTLGGTQRQRKPGGGRKTALDSPAQKLLFALVYLKTYPLQAVLGELFGLSQSRANRWIHQLLPVLQRTLKKIGVRPARHPHQFARHERQTGEPLDLIIDGTDRRRQRPKKPEKQALYYSGRKKTHSDKNVVIANRQTQRIGYLSKTYAGKTQDKKVVDQERIVYPHGARLHQDTSFQGYAPRGWHDLSTEKKPRKGKLTPTEKRWNRRISQVRVGIEHAIAGVKRSRIVKDVLRNRKAAFSDLAMEIACGLQNWRVRHRKRRLRW